MGIGWTKKKGISIPLFTYQMVTFLMDELRPNQRKPLLGNLKYQILGDREVNLVFALCFSVIPSICFSEFFAFIHSVR